jgi:prephenate dehydrogenase
MADVTVTILGLKRTGTSVGLALKRYNATKSDHQFTIRGYETDPEYGKLAQKAGAVDKLVNRPDEAVEGTDLVVVAMPIGEVEGAYQRIAPALRLGAVILDMSPLSQKSLALAKKVLPDEVHVVCATPLVNAKYLFEGTDEPSRATDDLFDNGLIMLMPSVTCVKEAISLASDLSIILGATPQFIDPAEHDSLYAATEILPSLLGVVAFRLLTRSQGWSDMQRLINPSLGMASRHLFDTHPDDLKQVWMAGDGDLVRYLDALIAELREVRTVLAEKDDAALSGLAEQTSRDYEVWINRRQRNLWGDEEERADLMNQGGGIMSNMFGSFLGGRGNNKNK